MVRSSLRPCKYTKFSVAAHRPHPEMTRLSMQGRVVSARLIVNRFDGAFALVLPTVRSDQFPCRAFACERVRVRAEDVPRECACRPCVVVGVCQVAADGVALRGALAHNL